MIEYSEDIQCTAVVELSESKGRVSLIYGLVCPQKSHTAYYNSRLLVKKVIKDSKSKILWCILNPYQADREAKALKALGFKNMAQFGNPRHGYHELTVWVYYNDK
jgi:hypothetical protein